MTHDIYRALESRYLSPAGAATRIGCVAPVTSYPALVGSVFGNPVVPMTTGCYFSVHPVDLSGTEREASPGVLTVDTSRSFLSYLVGSKVPVAGDLLVCRFVGHRWVADRVGKSVSEVTLPGCFCSETPTSLTMTSSKPDSNNQIFRNAILTYGPTPPELAPLALGTSCFLSTTWFTETSTGDQFRYYLNCSGGGFNLTRVFAKSIYGSPFREYVRYRWPTGYPGNICQPFLLSVGQIFAGGDKSCVVTISE